MSEESLHEAGESLPPPPSLSHPSSSALSSPPAADTPNSNGNSSNRMSRRLSRSSLFPEDDIDVQVPALQRLGIAGARSEDSSPAMSDAFPIQSALKSNSTNKESNSKSASFAPAPKGSDKQRVAFEEGDDNASRSSIGNIDGVKPKKANLSIRLEDEARIIASLHNAAKKQTTGSIYSVIVDLSRTGTLDIGVKDLSDNILVVSLLKRHNDRPGAGEEAGKHCYYLYDFIAYWFIFGISVGIRLGDVIFGVNFFPVREGSKTLIEVIKGDAEKKKKFLHIQAWRCHQLCSDDIPGYIFPRADEMIVQSYALFRSKVFGEWERWNFVEIILG